MASSSYKLLLRSEVGRAEVLVDRPLDPMLITALWRLKLFELLTMVFEILRLNGGRVADGVLELEKHFRKNRIVTEGGAHVNDREGALKVSECPGQCTKETQYHYC